MFLVEQPITNPENNQGLIAAICKMRRADTRRRYIEVKIQNVGGVLGNFCFNKIPPLKKVKSV